MHRAIVWGLLLVALPCAAQTPPPPASPFEDIPFAAALQRAKAEHKIVFIDFFTTWCGPCKLLDATTWRDPGVIALLKAKTIPLRLDAEKNADLAKRYSVEAYPTLALVKPDGTVLDTLVGYKDTPTFTAAFNDSLNGKTTLDQAQAAVEKAPGGDASVDARYKLGQELAEKGHNAEALAELLWCFDDGMKNSVGYTGVRVSFLLNDLGSLARRYPPAKAAMETRRDQAQKQLAAAPADSAAATDYAELNHYLGQDAATLAYFDKLPADSPQRPVLGSTVFDLLLESKRYPDAVSAQPAARFRQLFVTINLSLYMMPKSEAADMRDYEGENAAKEIEALAGAGQLDDARELIKMVIAADNSPATQDALRQHLTRAGHPELLPKPAAP